MKRSTVLFRRSVVLLAVAGGLALSGSSRAEIIERLVAKVNGDIVTQSEFEARQLAAVQAAHVTPEQVETYLRQNNSRILQEIVLPDAEQARDVVRRARAGEDFSALARASSTAGSRSTGGDLGQVAAADMNPELARIVGALAPGGVSEPIETDKGYRIVRVVSKEEASVKPFEEVKDDIVKQLSQQRMASAYEEYIEGLRKASERTTP